MRKTLSLLTLAILTVSIQAAVWYVKPDAVSTAWNTKEDTQVKTSFAEAFEAAAQNDEIWMAAGVHTVGATTSFNKHIKVYGGFEGNETSIADRAMVADGKAWEFQHTTYLEPAEGYNGSFMGVPSGQNILINGITFRKFKMAPCAIRQNTWIEQCVFTENTSTTDGACINMYPGGHAVDSYFYNNKGTTSVGVRINVLNQLASITGCTFEGNEGTWGIINITPSGGHNGDDKPTTLKDNIVINNKATDGNNNAIVRSVLPTCNISNTLVANNEGIPLLMEAGVFINGTIVNNTIPKTGTGNNNNAVFFNSTTNAAKLYNTVVWNNVDANNNVVGVAMAANSIAEITNCAIDGAVKGLSETATAENTITLEAENDGEEAEKFYPRFTSPAEGN